MKKISIFLGVLLFIGCGGGGSSPETKETNNTISPVVVDEVVVIEESNNSIEQEDENSSAIVDTNSSSSLVEYENSNKQILGKAQLGVLAEATVKLYELDDGIKKLLATEITSKGDTIDGIGNFNLHLEMIKNDEFYIYEVSGGYDYDSDDNGIIDGIPTQNKGVFHLLVEGSSLKSAKQITITVVSEIIYQKVLPFLDSDEIKSKMLLYSKEVIKKDIDGSGFIDINDVLYYDPINGKGYVHDSYRDIILQMIINILNGRNFDINYPTDEEGVQQALDSGDYNYIINQLLNNADAYNMSTDEINMNIAGAYIGKADYTAYDMVSAIANDSSSLNGFIYDITKNNNAVDTLKNLDEADIYYSSIVDGLDCSDTTGLSDEQKGSCFNLGLVRLTSLSNSVKLLFGGDENVVEQWALGVDINSSDDLNGNSVVDSSDASACAIVYASNPNDNCRDGTIHTYRGGVTFNNSETEYSTTLIEVDVGSSEHGYSTFYKLIKDGSVILTDGSCDKNFNLTTEIEDGINYFPCPTLNNQEMMNIQSSLSSSANIQYLFPLGSTTRTTINNYILNITGSVDGSIEQNNLSSYLQRH
ncbi:hypothetical protein GSY74_00870 [Sulfurovum sp. bin170]|uniref:hypothetical protein n=1 Tax=Sulfurovum sp. bin170 TaxID=2695268 RepID=UPI0013E028CE|nr:hypothetical protein [Sulfurovum sp. bin170]NEW59820.1 hypothetical protein [Sulfurovum sp. bin170]